MLDPLQMALASACVEAADAESFSRLQRARNNGNMVFPIVSLRV